MSDEPDSGGNNFNSQTIRIKAVSEINSSDVVNEETENTTMNKTKRKIPCWLLAPKSENVKCPKKQKLSNESLNSNDHDLTEVDTSNSISQKDETNEMVSTTSITNQANNKKEASTNETRHETKEEQVDSSNNVDIKIKIKEEIKQEQFDSNENTDIVNDTSIHSLNIVKQEASSTIRESCKFGIRCYRRNPMHRNEMAHPGDNDYKRPHYPPPPKGTPKCPYGDKCYRRNPIHFQDYSHPPSTADFEKNRRERKEKRNQKKKEHVEYDNYEDDDENENPFLTDSDEDYIPSDSEDDDDYNFASGSENEKTN